MSKTTMVVLIVTAVLVVCIIGAAITFGIVYRGSKLANGTGLLNRKSIDLNESADIDLNGVEYLNIENVSGQIFVKVGEPHVTLTGRIRTNIDQEKFLLVENENGKLTVKSDLDTFYPRYVSGHMVLTVYLPEDMAIDTSVSSASASAEIEGIRFGDLTVHSASGDVDIQNCAGGNLRINVTSGKVDAKNVDFGYANINGTSGDITVDGLTGSIQADNTSGGVTVSNVAGSVEIGNTSGNATVIQPQTSIQPIRIKNVSGGIKVVLNPEAAFDLDVNTTSGGFSSDFDMTVSGKLAGNIVGKDVSGTVNGGGSAVKLSTVSGGISIKRGN